jgi:hypothetical protein
LISRKFTRPGGTDAHRFPPWFVEEQPTCFVVRDHNGQALAYVGTYRSNCNVKLTAMDRLKPSRSAKRHVGKHHIGRLFAVKCNATEFVA